MLKKELAIILGIFFLAAAVRFIYLYESSANPSFTAPTVDSGTYDRIAGNLAQGKGMNYEFFWQPLFYPVFLSAVYAVSNSSILFAKIIQLLLGSLTCVLTFLLGKKIFDFRTGLFAAVIAALCGPLIFLETELLANCWSDFWAVILLLLFLKIQNAKKILPFLILGLCGALSVITRPTFLPFFVMAVLWLIFGFYKYKENFLKSSLKFSAIIIGFALVVIPVSFINLRVTGHFGFMPATGGINFYIGNNPDFKQTVTARPGWSWEELTSMPQRNGVVGDMWKEQKYFNKKVTDYVLNQPFLFIKGLAYKTLEFFSSREIPRNTSIYLFGKWSHLLSALVWEKAGFGFPFGVLLPFSILASFAFWRQIPVPVKLFLIFYPLAVILVFISGRYRTEIIPIMSILSAAGFFVLIDFIRNKKFKALFFSAIFGIAIILISSLPGPFPEETPNFEAELYANVGAAELNSGNYTDAKKHLEKSLELMPDNNGMAQANLGTALFREGKIESAVDCFTKALKHKPDSVEILTNFATILADCNKPEQAFEYFKKAIEINPYRAIIWYDIANIFYKQKNFPQAIRYYKKAISLDAGYNKAWINLGWAYYELEQMDDSLVCFEKAYSIDNNAGDVRYHLAWLNSYKGNQLLQEKKLDEAEKYLTKAIQFFPADPKHYLRLSQVLLEKGQTQKAASVLENAINSIEIKDQKDIVILKENLTQIRQNKN